MRYENVVSGVFLERPNRFIAKVLIDNEINTVHVKNTGRCREILVKGAKVYLCQSDNPERKTKYDLIAVEKNKGDHNLLINIDSQIPNDVAYEWISCSELFLSNAVIKREYTFGNSRFDIHVQDGDKSAFIEVKGVTLEHDGIAKFPDAPTERGVKHVKELIECVKQGHDAYILFVIQMKEIKEFRPYDEMHAEFGDALRLANQSGVKILAMDCIVNPDSLIIDKPVKVNLRQGIKL